jgi:hypothetical protein
MDSFFFFGDTCINLDNCESDLMVNDFCTARSMIIIN